MQQGWLFDLDPIPSADESIALSATPTKSVILLGNLTKEGVISKIHSFGYRYENRLLQSSPQNWRRIEAFLKQLSDSGNIIAIFVHLYERVLLLFHESEYRDLWARFVDIMKNHPTLVFVYDDNLLGKFTTFEEMTREYEQHYARFSMSGSTDVIRRLEREFRERQSMLQNQMHWAMNTLDYTLQSGLEIASYKKNSEITMRIHDYLDEIDSGTFLRLYVPNGMYQGEQLSRLLGIFESYLRNVEGRSFQIETRKTQRGVIYVFKSSQGRSAIHDLDDAILRFDHFMKLCQTDDNQAQQVLTRMGVPDLDASALIVKYKIDYQRVIMDVNREREVKLMKLKHQIQAELFEYVHKSILPARQEGAPPSILSMMNPPSITINITDNRTTQSFIEQQINGNITYNESDKELLNLFRQHSDKLGAVQLQSDLNQLKDSSAPPETRQSARQRITNFLLRLGNIAAENGVVSGIRVLAAYVEKLINTPPP